MSPVMASKLLVPFISFLMLLLLLMSNMAIANAASSRTQDLKIIHYHKGHNNHEKGRVRPPFEFYASFQKGYRFQLLPLPCATTNIGVVFLVANQAAMLMVFQTKSMVEPTEDVSQKLPSKFCSLFGMERCGL